MRALQDVACLGLVVALTVAGPAFSHALLDDASALERLDGAFTHGAAAAAGAFDVQCGGPLVYMRPEIAGLRLMTGSATVRLFETNVTRIETLGSDDAAVQTRGEQSQLRAKLALPVGTSLLVAPTGELNLGLRPAGPTNEYGDIEALTLWQNATNLHWTIDGILPIRDRGVVTLNDGGLKTLARPHTALKIDSAAPSRINGTGFGYLEEVTFDGPGLNFAMPPRTQVVQEAGDARVAAVQRVIEAHAVLDFTNATFALDAGAADVYCSRLGLVGDGTVTLENARGALVRGNQNEAVFDNETATVEGRIHSGSSTANTDLFTASGKVDAPPPVSAKLFWGAGIAVAAGWAIVRFGPFGAALFYTRVSVPKALTHPLRALVHKAVQGRPGVTVRELTVSTGRNYGALRHHGLVLARLGLLKQLRYGRDVHLYPSGASLTEARRALVWNQDSTARWLAEWMGSTGGSPQDAMNALRTTVGISRVGAWKAMRRVEREGLLRARPTL